MEGNNSPEQQQLASHHWVWGNGDNGLLWAELTDHAGGVARHGGSDDYHGLYVTGGGIGISCHNHADVACGKEAG